MPRSLLIGNWKMNGNLAQMNALLSELSQAQLNENVDVVVCPVAVYLPQALQQLQSSRITVGAQNAAAEAQGAYTGEVAASMLADIGCKYAILGHSERRAYYGETNSSVALKAQQCLEVDICPVICVGETLQQREQDQTLDVVSEQLAAVFDVLNTQQLAQLVIAYEPVWAIGTGLTASPAQAQAVHAHIRSLLAQQSTKAAETVPLLYGGSVNASNAEALFAQIDIDGGLIGGASLKADEFSAIINSAG